MARRLTVPEKYCRTVARSKKKYPKYVRLACQRHLDDLKNLKGHYFDHEEGMMMIEFFPLFLRHSKGKWAGKPFELEPYQQFIVYCLYGWKRSDGSRRFRYANIFMPRKNGKSTFMSGLSLIGLWGDDEKGSEVYYAATKRDQAMIVFNEAKKMVEQSPHLLDHITPYKYNLHDEESWSKAEPISSDRDTQDGLNVHYGIIDEYHAHKDDAVFNVLKSATGARRQPLIAIISTAGFKRRMKVPCLSLWEVCRKVLDGQLKDESMFCIIWEPDEDDDWKKKSTWIKVNPGYGTALDPNYLETEFKQAKNYGGTQEVNFRTKHCNEWVDSEVTWIPDHIWMKSGTKPVDCDGRVCYGGLDLASVRDITALALVFPNDDGSYNTKRFYWLPEETVDARIERGDENYYLWKRDGHITTTPGNVTDYERIIRDITGHYVEDGVVKFDPNNLRDRYTIRSIAYDPYNGQHIIPQLEGHGISCSKFRQGWVTMSAPTKQLEKLIFQKLINHENDPVLRWMIGNSVIKIDPANNYKLDKEKSADKIDGVVALVMAIGESVTPQDNKNTIPKNYVPVV